MWVGWKVNNFKWIEWIQSVCHKLVTHLFSSIQLNVLLWNAAKYQYKSLLTMSNNLNRTTLQFFLVNRTSLVRWKFDSATV